MSKKQSKKNQSKKNQQQSSSMKLEALEPRLLMSGDTYEDLNQAWDFSFR